MSNDSALFLYGLLVINLITLIVTSVVYSSILDTREEMWMQYCTSKGDTYEFCKITWENGSLRK